MDNIIMSDFQKLKRQYEDLFSRYEILEEWVKEKGLIQEYNSWFYMEYQYKEEDRQEDKRRLSEFLDDEIISEIFNDEDSEK